MKHAGHVIQTGREAAGLSQLDLAELAGVNQGYLSAVEQGKRHPSRRWMKAVLHAIAEAMTGDAA